MQLHVEKLVFEGWGLAREGGLVHFVDGALPGETVEAEVALRKKHHVYCRLTRVVSRSPDRVEPPCPAFGRCGGCHLLHCAYPAQIAAKRDVVVEALHFLPRARELTAEVIPSPEPVGFRNTMSFAVARDERGGPVIGLHARGQAGVIVSADRCVLQSAESIELRRRLCAAFAAEAPDAALPSRAIIREGRRTGERMLVLEGPVERSLLDRAAASCGELCTTVVAAGKGDGSGDAAGGVLKGPGFVTEKLGPYVFEIRPHAFFQTNTRQAERLFGFLRDKAAAVAPRRALDFYAGAGVIAMFLSGVAGEVMAFESHPSSVRAARRNLDRHGIRNVRVIRAAVESARVHARERPVDLAVIDPPREGLSPGARARLLEIEPARLLYVSCHPATLARDARALLAAGYEAEWVQPFDMFPQTFHVEIVAGFRMRVGR